MLDNSQIAVLSAEFCDVNEKVKDTTEQERTKTKITGRGHGKHDNLREKFQI